ncbi:MAG: long-chain fatty acid--CoA ligase [Deltaproteobacteria bacterium]|jgi:long-chain acyl-CoA synthetase|nr:long-chain fatty acid--CoA ligase [Deltaproteobacteria bacterium]
MSQHNSNLGPQPTYSLYAPDGQSYSPWLKNYDPSVPGTADVPNVPLAYWLDRAAAQAPNADAIVFKNYRLSYRQLQEQAEIMAANLRLNGIQKGDAVAVMLPNLPQTFLAVWAVIKAGGVLVMTNSLYVENELLYQLNDAKVKCLITTDTIWPKVERLRARLLVKKYFVTDMSDGLAFPLNAWYKFKNSSKNGSLAFDTHSVLPFKGLLKGGARLSTLIDNPAETLAILQYSGGTTGVPKGAMLTHRNIAANVVQGKHVIFPNEAKRNYQRFLGVMPLFHVYGLLTCLFLPVAVCSSVYPMPMFAPGEALAMLEKYKINIVPGAPSVYIAMLQQKTISAVNLSSVDILISGSAPMPVEYFKIFKEKTGATIIEGYGLTEASPITHLNPAEGMKKNGSIGMPLPSTEARIVDMELGNIPLPPGRAGELIVKGPQVMRGYWNRPDETANVLRNGWLYTGDIAIMDEDGYFYIVDRKKDMVIVGGYNVYPREIDEVLHAHPAVREAVAVGISHPTRGEIIKAYVVLNDGASLKKSDIISYCRSHLANYKVPKQVEFRKELPKSLVGKVLRRALRAEEEEKLKSPQNLKEYDKLDDKALVD